LNAEPLNLFLIGYRCTGKTTVGRYLAEELGWAFVDTDSLLVEQQRMNITEIVGAHGWEKFRKLEREILKTVCISQRQVVASGGGIVLDDRNVVRMRQNGKTIWLRAKHATIKARMLQDKDSSNFRPALTLNDSLTEIEETMQLREPIYYKAMDFFVDTDDHDIHKISDIITEKLKTIIPELF